jgi:hypothetical protein
MTESFPWEESLRLIGTCSYLGTIPVEAITCVATVDILANPYVAHIALRLVIALPNYQFYSKEYRSLTRWVFGDDDETDRPFTHDFGDGLVVQDFQWPPAPNRDGITVTEMGRGHEPANR